MPSDPSITIVGRVISAQVFQGVLSSGKDRTFPLNCIHFISVEAAKRESRVPTTQNIAVPDPVCFICGQFISKASDRHRVYNDVEGKRGTLKPVVTSNIDKDAYRKQVQDLYALPTLPHRDAYVCARHYNAPLKDLKYHCLEPYINYMSLEQTDALRNFINSVGGKSSQFQKFSKFDNLDQFIEVHKNSADTLDVFWENFRNSDIAMTRTFYVHKDFPAVPLIYQPTETDLSTSNHHFIFFNLNDPHGSGCLDPRTEAVPIREQMHIEHLNQVKVSSPVLFVDNITNTINSSRVIIAPVPESLYTTKLNNVYDVSLSDYAKFGIPSYFRMLVRGIDGLFESIDISHIQRETAELVANRPPETTNIALYSAPITTVLPPVNTDDISIGSNTMHSSLDGHGKSHANIITATINPNYNSTTTISTVNMDELNYLETQKVIANVINTNANNSKSLLMSFNNVSVNTNNIYPHLGAMGSMGSTPVATSITPQSNFATHGTSNTHLDASQYRFAPNTNTANTSGNTSTGASNTAQSQLYAQQQQILQQQQINQHQINQQQQQLLQYQQQLINLQSNNPSTLASNLAANLPNNFAAPTPPMQPHSSYFTFNSAVPVSSYNTNQYLHNVQGLQNILSPGMAAPTNVTSPNIITNLRKPLRSTKTQSSSSPSASPRGLAVLSSSSNQLPLSSNIVTVDNSLPTSTPNDTVWPGTSSRLLPRGIGILTQESSNPNSNSPVFNTTTLNLLNSTSPVLRLPSHPTSSNPSTTSNSPGQLAKRRNIQTSIVPASQALVKLGTPNLLSPAMSPVISLPNSLSSTPVTSHKNFIFTPSIDMGRDIMKDREPRLSGNIYTYFAQDIDGTHSTRGSINYGNFMTNSLAIPATVNMSSNVLTSPYLPTQLSSSLSSSSSSSSSGISSHEFLTTMSSNNEGTTSFKLTQKPSDSQKKTY